MKTIEYFNKPAHMRPFKMMRKVHIHIYGCNSSLTALRLVKNSYWVGYGFNPDLLNINSPMINLVLDIFHFMIGLQRERRL